MGYENREDSQQMDWRNDPRHNTRSNEMSAPGDVTSYAPKRREPPMNDYVADDLPKVPPAPPAPSEPAVISIAIDRAIGRIGDIAAAEMEATADDIMAAAEHVAGEFRRLAEAMRQTSAGHGKAASDFCTRMRTSYDAVRTLSESFNPPATVDAEGHPNEPPIEPKDVPKFLKRK